MAALGVNRSHPDGGVLLPNKQAHSDLLLWFCQHSPPAIHRPLIRQQFGCAGGVGIALGTVISLVTVSLPTLSVQPVGAVAVVGPTPREHEGTQR